MCVGDLVTLFEPDLVRPRLENATKLRPERTVAGLRLTSRPNLRGRTPLQCDMKTTMGGQSSPSQAVLSTESTRVSGLHP